MTRFAQSCHFPQASRFREARKGSPVWNPAWRPIRLLRRRHDPRVNKHGNERKPVAQVPRDISTNSGFGELLVLGREAAPGTHLALRWISRLPTKRKEEEVQMALDNIARFASHGSTGADRLAWHQLRFWHTAAIRAALLEMDHASYSAKALRALRRVLERFSY